MTYQRKTDREVKTYINTKNRKVPLADYPLIASLRQAGHSLLSIARKWKVDHTTIGTILKKMKIAPPACLIKAGKPKPELPKYPEPKINPGMDYAEYLLLEKKRKKKKRS